MDEAWLSVFREHKRRAECDGFHQNDCVINDIPGLCFDASHHFLDKRLLCVFEALSQHALIHDRFAAMLRGEVVNRSENQAALHTLLRASPTSCPSNLKSDFIQVKQCIDQMDDWASALREKRYLGSSGQAIEHVVHLGIGGSHLGPKMTYQALVHDEQAVGVSFVSSIDEMVLSECLSSLNPHTTLVLIVSKSFTTQETLLNAHRVKSWLQAELGEDIERHLWAVTASSDRAMDWGVKSDHIFPMWSWVGGRFSVWSAANATLMLALGREGFNAFLEGASIADQNASNRDLSHNIALLSACLDLWYNLAWDCQVQAVMPYAHALASLPDYLQQLSMESLGKSVDEHGAPVLHSTGMALFGAPGTESQHSICQLLTQGTRRIPLDIVLPLGAGKEKDVQRWLWAHGLSQYSVLGQRGSDKVDASGMPQPCTLWLLESLTPYTLGAFLACYEHRIFFQSVLLGINAFDQWGVEEGKRLSPLMEEALQKQTNASLADYFDKQVVDFILKSI